MLQLPTPQRGSGGEAELVDAPATKRPAATLGEFLATCTHSRDDVKPPKEKPSS
jgi:hypothetical protein